MRLPEDETVLNVFRKRQGVTHRQLGEIAKATTSAAQRWCLPRKAKGHRRPNARAAEAIRVWSGGEVTIANYADPYLPAGSAGAAPVKLNPADRVPEDIQ